MNDNALKIILNELEPVFAAQKLVRQQGDDVVYTNSTHAVKIWYNEEKKLFMLDLAVLNGEDSVDFVNKSMYLFDEGSNDKDAKSVGSDFADTLNNAFGVVHTRRASIDLPSKAAPGSTPGEDAFCNRFLTLYPQYKDKYKADVERYGDFLYERFFSETAAVKLNELMTSGDKKAIIKMLQMLDEFYVDGNFDVQSTITYTIIGGAFRNDNALFEKACAFMEDNAPHLLIPSKNMMEHVIAKENKKK
ncbi:MAG: hypothetical protein IJO89_04665 [Clostridia bacterium]|nr:hypothetical protein [Clostridia bacterium]